MMDYISSLHSASSSTSTSTKEAEPMQTEPETATASTTNDALHPKYDASSGAEDYEAAGNYKQQASDAAADGDYTKALDMYNQAVLAAPPSALLYANRAMVLEKLGHYSEAILDCTWALELNPDSAKALKVRGKLRYKHVQDWHGALEDLNQAQAIDFDPDVVEILKELTQLRVEEEQQQAQERNAEMEKKRKKAEEIKRAQQEAREAASAEASRSRGPAGGGGFPGAGMPGGGMPGMDPSMMAGLMSDPEIQEAMKNPKVVAAFQELMSGPGGPMALLSNPAKLQQLMMDPEVGPVLQKIMGKFMGGGAGAGAGGAGMNPFGAAGAGGGMPPGNDFGGDDIPDLGEMPDID